MERRTRVSGSLNKKFRTPQNLRNTERIQINSYSFQLCQRHFYHESQKLNKCNEARLCSRFGQHPYESGRVVPKLCWQ